MVYSSIANAKRRFTKVVAVMDSEMPCQVRRKRYQEVRGLCARKPKDHPWNWNESRQGDLGAVDAENGMNKARMDKGRTQETHLIGAQPTSQMFLASQLFQKSASARLCFIGFLTIKDFIVVILLMRKQI